MFSWKNCLNLLISFGFLSGCAIHRPCSEGGDVTWNPKIVGDKRCGQRKLPSGKIVNEGKFQQYYQKTGNLALEGQFEEGQKQGIWSYYGEDQHLKVVKYFDKGIEKTPPSDVQKKIDLIIQQKSGMK